MPDLILPRSKLRRWSLYNWLQALGLTDGLKLCLDVGSVASYPGSGTKLYDISGNGHNFNFGNGSTSSTFPTYVANGVASYLSFDGGDYLTLDSSIASWMQNLYDPTAAHYASHLSIVRLPSDTATPIMGCRGNATNERGWGLEYSDSFNRALIVGPVQDESAFQAISGSAPGTLDTLLPGLFIHQMTHAIGLSGEAGSMVNGNNYTGADGNVSQFSTGNPTNNLRIGAYGDLSTIAPNGFRFYGGAVWSHSAPLSSAKRQSLFAAIRSRYGL